MEFRDREMIKMSPDQWVREFSQLSGLILNVEGESTRAPEERRLLNYIRKLKEEKPEQLLICHFDGYSSLHLREHFPPSCWQTYQGSLLKEDLTANSSQIQLVSTENFRADFGISKVKANDDIVISKLNDSGEIDLSTYEYVKLLAINGRMIEVRRGCYGTTPLAFSRSRAYAAPIVVQGPDERGNFNWVYNFSTKAPKDKHGKMLKDHLSEIVSKRFADEEMWQVFDGLVFDVLFQTIKSTPSPRISGEGYQPRYGTLIDTDYDMKGDQGIVGGIDCFRTGVELFLGDLRKKLPDKIILADGQTFLNHRATKYLNGIESEGWPTHRYFAFRRWTPGVNLISYWSKHARRPAFNLINYRFDFPANGQRLLFAVSCFFESPLAFCFTYPINDDFDKRIGVWDEFNGGIENRLGWLGMPKGELVRVARRKEDLLGGSGVALERSFLKRIKDADLEELPGGVLRITPTDVREKFNTEKITRHIRYPNAHFKIEKIPTGRGDMLIHFQIRALSDGGFNNTDPRAIHFRESPDIERSELGFCIVGNEWFDCGLYVRGSEVDHIDLHFNVEGDLPIEIGNFKVHAYPDVMYREFDNGVVIGNPSDAPVEFSLDEAFPGQKLEKLKGQYHPIFNDGSPVSGVIQLGALDAIFLRKTE